MTLLTFPPSLKACGRTDITRQEAAQAFEKGATKRLQKLVGITARKGALRHFHDKLHALTIISI